MPKYFSVLGYENGLLLKNILLHADNALSITSLIDQIGTLNITGPRGNIEFDKATNRTLFNHYIYKLDIDSSNDIRFNKIETFLNDGHFTKAFNSSTKTDTVGGWHNSYLCH